MPANHDLSNNSSNASEDLENRKKLEKIFMFFFAALFLCLPFVAQYQISFSGKEALVSDGLTFYVPLLKEQADTIRSGVLPLWSPSLFCGSPTLANPSIGFFEPSQLLYFFFSPVYASNLAPIAISGLILCLIFLMSYRVGLKGFAIFIPILVLLPKLLAYTSAPDYVWGLGLIPLLFLAIESYFQDVARRSSATCFIVMIGSSLILWGHPSCFFPGGIGIAIYCLLRIRVEDESLKKLGWFIGIGAAIIGVTAVLWIPFNEFRLSSGRGISNTNSFLPSLPYESWIAIFVPGFFGSDSARTTWRDIELPFATLIPILALLPISLLHLHRRFRVAAIILFILPVIIATGESAPWGPILRHIPGLLLLRHVSFWTYLMVIASMWIVASGMNQLQSVTHKPDNVATIWENLYRNLGIASIFISVLVGIWIAAGPISPDWVRWLADDLGTNTIPANIWDHRAASLNVAREATFFAGLTWTASFFTIAWGLKSGSLPKLVIVMLVVLNLFQINNYKADVWEGSTEEIVHAAKKELAEFSPEGRIWTNGLSLTAYLIGRSSRPPYRLAEHAEQKEYIVPDEQEGRSRKIFKSLLKGLPANMVVLFDGRQFNGYSTLIPKRLIEFVTAGQRDAAINRMPQPEIPWNRLPGLTTVISSTPLPADSVLELGGQISASYIYRVIDPMPRAVLAGNWITLPSEEKVLESIGIDTQNRSPRFIKGSVPPNQLISDLIPLTPSFEDPNTVEFEVETKRSVPLVLYDLYYPGWNATIDGQDVEIVPADHAFRAVLVPPGKHTVRFSFRPRSTKMGAVISFVTILFVVFVCFWRSKRMRAAQTNSL